MTKHLFDELDDRENMYQHVCSDRQTSRRRDWIRRGRQWFLSSGRYPKEVYKLNHSRKHEEKKEEQETIPWANQQEANEVESEEQRELQQSLCHLHRLLHLQQNMIDQILKR